MGARHYDDRGQTACWPGRALNFTTKRHEVTCGSCHRTRAFRDAPPDPPDPLGEVIPARVWPRNGRTSVKHRLARELGAHRTENPQDSAVVDAWTGRLAV